MKIGVPEPYHLLGIFFVVILFVISTTLYVKIQRIHSVVGVYHLTLTSTTGIPLGSGTLTIASLHTMIGNSHTFPFFHLYSNRWHIESDGMVTLTPLGKETLIPHFLPVVDAIPVFPDDVESNGYLEIKMTTSNALGHAIWCAPQKTDKGYSGTLYVDEFNPMSRTAIGAVAMDKRN
jgi:hypothetical protein